MEDITAPGRQLHQRFQRLGSLSGKTAEEIVETVGEPSSISTLGDGQTLLQWQAPGCHMSLVFDEQARFVEISHQYAQYEEFSIDSYAPEESNSTPIVIGLVVGLLAGIALLVSMFL